MKTLAIAALVAAQLAVAAQPAMAADLGDPQAVSSQRQGAFAGARIRVPLSGEKAGKARAALTMAPVLYGRQSDGSMRTRFGEGVEFGFAGTEKAELSLGGRAVSQIARGRTGPDGRRLGTSTGKELLIVGGILVLTAGAVTLLLVSQE
jgi:hypothetical protein